MRNIIFQGCPMSLKELLTPLSKVDFDEIIFLTFFVEKVLITSEFSVIRKLLDSYLIRTDWNSLPDKTFEDIGHILEQSDQIIFQILSREGNLGLLELVFKSFKLTGVTPDVDCIRINHESVLHTAMTAGHLDVVELLVREGASVDFIDSLCRSVLHIAANSDNLKAVQFLVQHGAEVDRSDVFEHTPFLEAVTCGSLDMVKYLLAHGAYVDSADNRGMTALHQAAEKGDFAKVKCLVENGADVNSKSFSGTSLFNAVRGENFNIVRYLVRKGADVTHRNEERRTVLHAFKKNCPRNIEEDTERCKGVVKICKFLMERGVSINSVDAKGHTVLHSVVHRICLVEFLVENGADLCLVNKSGNTALEQAVQRGAFKTVKYLMEKGAPTVNLAQIMFSADNEYLDVIKYLAEKGADLNVMSNEENPMLHVALYNNNFAMIKFLIEKGVVVNVAVLFDDAFRHCNFDTIRFLIDHIPLTEEDLALIKLLLEDGESFDKEEYISRNLKLIEYMAESKGVQIDMQRRLYLASRDGDLGKLKHLMERGVDVNSTFVDKYESTALHQTAIYDHPHVIKFLLEKGALINVRDVHNCTPLFKAVLKDSIESAQVLIENGADVNCITNYGDTALLEAIRNNRFDLVKSLVEHGAVVNLKRKSRDYLLATALTCGDMDIAEYLLENNVHVKGKVKDVVQHLLDDNMKPTCYELIDCIMDNLDTVTSLLQRGVHLDPYLIKRHELFYRAAEEGNLILLKLLIDAGGNVNETNGYGMTALHVTCAPHLNKHYFNTAKFLLRNGADINAKTTSGLSVLHHVTKYENVDLCKFFIRYGADINSLDEEGRTALFVAAAKGSLRNAKLLVENGAQVNVRDKAGFTPLHVAAGHGDYRRAKSQLKVMKFLIEKGAEVNAQSQNGRTPLHEAASKCDVEKIELLIRKRSNVNVQTDNGSTPLYELFKMSTDKLTDPRRDDVSEEVKLLVESGAYFKRKKEDGRTLLHEAFSWGDLNVVQFLIDRGLDAKDKTNEGGTSLHEAAKSGKVGLAAFLLQNGLEVNAKTAYGRTPLHDAVINGPYQPMVRYLIQNGADVQCKTDDGSTALHMAANIGNLEAVKVLVEAGADVTVKNAKGFTAQCIADENQNFDISNYLAENNAGMDFSYA